MLSGIQGSEGHVCYECWDLIYIWVLWILQESRQDSDASVVAGRRLVHDDELLTEAAGSFGASLLSPREFQYVHGDCL